MTDHSDDAEPVAAFDLTAMVSQLVAAHARPDRETLRLIRAHVVQVVRQSTYEIPANRAISGIRLDGRPIRQGDPIEVRRAKWLQHAVRQEQWPSGTTFEDFCDSITSIIERDENGIHAERQGGDWKLTFVGRSGMWEGLEGADFIIVKYDCREQRFVTAFQPDRGLDYVEHNEQGGSGRWLRRPR